MRSLVVMMMMSGRWMGGWGCCILSRGCWNVCSFKVANVPLISGKLIFRGSESTNATQLQSATQRSCFPFFSNKRARSTLCLVLFILDLF